MSLGVEGMTRSPRMQTREKRSRNQASLTEGKCVWLTGGRIIICSLQVICDASEREGLKAKMKGGRAGGRRVAWRKMRNYWRLIRKKEGMKRSSKGTPNCEEDQWHVSMSAALHDWNGGELLPLIVCS